MDSHQIWDSDANVAIIIILKNKMAAAAVLDSGVEIWCSPLPRVDNVCLVGRFTTFVD